MTDPPAAHMDFEAAKQILALVGLRLRETTVENVDQMVRDDPSPGNAVLVALSDDNYAPVVLACLGEHLPRIRAAERWLGFEIGKARAEGEPA